MRVVMLGANPNVGFLNREAMSSFFTEGLCLNEHDGMFRFPMGFIELGELACGESLVFNYQGQVEFTALAGSEIDVYSDANAPQFQRVFRIDLPTLRSVTPPVPLAEAQQFYNDRADAVDHVNLLTPGWNRLDEALPATRALWEHLGGWLRPDDAGDADPLITASTSAPTRELRPLVERLIRLRRGQGRFRDALLHRYASQCQVTGCCIVALLEAAHIQPYCQASNNDPENGLLLRADIHTLFDLDLLGINPKKNMRIELAPSVVAEYGHLAGLVLHCLTGSQPSNQALTERYARFCQQVPNPHPG